MLGSCSNSLHCVPEGSSTQTATVIRRLASGFLFHQVVLCLLSHVWKLLFHLFFQLCSCWLREDSSSTNYSGCPISFRWKPKCLTPVYSPWPFSDFIKYHSPLFPPVSSTPASSPSPDTPAPTRLRSFALLSPLVSCFSCKSTQMKASTQSLSEQLVLIICQTHHVLTCLFLYFTSFLAYFLSPFIRTKYPWGQGPLLSCLLMYLQCQNCAWHVGSSW